MLAVLPPVVGGDVGAVLHRAFAAVCHQMPERSAHLAGGPIALCHRCSGVLSGLILGIAVAPSLSGSLLVRINRSVQPGWLVAAVVPTALDWALGVAGVWANTPLSRSLTGSLFGLTAGLILAANLLVVSPRSTPTPSLAS